MALKRTRRQGECRTGRTVAHAARWLILTGGLFAGAAFAQSVDIVVNHDGLFEGADAAFGPAGGTFTYVAKVKHNNVGPTATGVVLTEQLPVGGVFQSYSSVPGGIACAPALAGGTTITALNRTQTCAIGSLAPADGFKTVSFNVVLPTVSTNWQASASATHAGTDPDTNNNTNLPRNFTTTQAADLAIALTAPATVTNGGAFNYTLNVTNNGPTAVPGPGRVVVTFAVPNGAIFMADPSGGGWSCTPNSGYPRSSGTLTCAYQGVVAVGAALPVLTVPALANSSGTISGAASVVAYENSGSALTDRLADGQSANNTSNASITSTGGDFVDVSLTKTVAPGNVDSQAPTAVTYTLQPRREAGAISPYGMRVTDALPAGVTQTGFTGLDPVWNCSASTATVIDCTHASTAGSPYAGGNFTDLPAIKFTASVPAGAVGNVTNTGVIGLPPALNEVNITNNESSVSVNRSNTAQLQIAKTGPTRPVQANTNFTFNLAIKNNGPVNILPGQAINVTENPGPGLTIVSMTVGDAANFTCGPVTTCAYTGGLANGASLNVTVTANVASATGSFATFGNSAGAGVTGRDSTVVNGNANVVVSNDTADVGIVKTVTSPAGAIKSGDEVTYRLRVTNNGAVAVTNLKVTDALNDLVHENEGGTVGNPAAPRYPGGGFISVAAPAGTTCPAPSGNVNSDTRNLTCTVASLAANQSVDIDVKIRPKVANSGAYSNTARAQSTDINDSVSANDQSTVGIPATAIVDLVALKQVSPTIAAAGEPLTFTATVRNDGPSSAQAVTLVDTLPSNAIIIGTPVVSDGGTCTPSGGAAATPATAGGTLNCAWAAAVPSGTQRTVTVKMRSLGNLAANTKVRNEIVVGTSTEEFTTLNNSANAEATLTRAELDVTIGMSHSADGLLIGEDTVYSIVVTNAGPSYATNVVMTDVFPANLNPTVPSSATFSYQGALTKLGAAAGAGSTCTEPAVNATTGPLTCTIPLLAPGQSATFRFTMKAQSLPSGASTGTIYHVATVAPAETEYLRNGDDVIVNNATTDRTSTSLTANNVDLGLTKQGPDGPLDAGDAVAYTLTVTNYGRDAQSPAGAVLKDVLPAGLDYVSSSAGCNYAGVTRTVTCAVPVLAKGAQTAFTVNTLISKPYTGARPLVNEASVTVAGDGEPSNNTSRKETKLKPPPSVAGIPTLSEWGLILLSVLLGLFAFRQMGGSRRW